MLRPQVLETQAEHLHSGRSTKSNTVVTDGDCDDITTLSQSTPSPTDTTLMVNPLARDQDRTRIVRAPPPGLCRQLLHAMTLLFGCLTIRLDMSFDQSEQ